MTSALQVIKDEKKKCIEPIIFNANCTQCHQTPCQLLGCRQWFINLRGNVSSPLVGLTSWGKMKVKISSGALSNPIPLGHPEEQKQKQFWNSLDQWNGIRKGTVEFKNLFFLRPPKFTNWLPLRFSSSQNMKNSHRARWELLQELDLFVETSLQCLS